MSCHEDRIATHKYAVKEVLPDLTEAQLEAVWALWAYHSPKVDRDEYEYAVVSYLTTECGVPHVDEAKKAVRAPLKFLCCMGA